MTEKKIYIYTEIYAKYRNRIAPNPAVLYEFHHQPYFVICELNQTKTCMREMLRTAPNISRYD